MGIRISGPDRRVLQTGDVRDILHSFQPIILETLQVEEYQRRYIVPESVKKTLNRENFLAAKSKTKW
jgi:hypothetical protein